MTVGVADGVVEFGTLLADVLLAGRPKAAPGPRADRQGRGVRGGRCRYGGRRPRPGLFMAIVEQLVTRSAMLSSWLDARLNGEHNELDCHRSSSA